MPRQHSRCGPNEVRTDRSATGHVRAKSSACFTFEASLKTPSLVVVASKYPSSAGQIVKGLDHIAPRGLRTAPLTSTPFIHFFEEPGQQAVLALLSVEGGYMVVLPRIFDSLTGNVLAGFNGDLNVTFDFAYSVFSLLFALIGSSTDTLTVQGFSGGVGGTLLGSVTTAGTVPAGFIYSEGFITFGFGSPFDALRITSTAADFAIDDLAVVWPATVAPFPNPPRRRCSAWASRAWPDAAGGSARPRKGRHRGLGMRPAFARPFVCTVSTRVRSVRQTHANHGWSLSS